MKQKPECPLCRLHTGVENATVWSSKSEPQLLSHRIRMSAVYLMADVCQIRAVVQLQRNSRTKSGQTFPFVLFWLRKRKSDWSIWACPSHATSAARPDGDQLCLLLDDGPSGLSLPRPVDAAGVAGYCSHCQGGPRSSPYSQKP